MLIRGQKYCFLGPTIFEISQLCNDLTQDTSGRLIKQHFFVYSESVCEVIDSQFKMEHTKHILA
jgi:hypothetical protein